VSETPFLVRLDHIAKSFGPVRALVDATLQVRPGTVHALLGENGAGKTTLMRIAFGMVQPDAGAIEWRGERHRPGSPAEAITLGIGMVHQHFTIVPTMTVAENVALGSHGRFERTAVAARIEDVGRRTGLRLDAAALAEDLPIGAQQRLEIVKALVRDARLLILDEPTAVLAPSEAEELLAWLRSFARDDRAVVLITHKLREALAVADDVTVLRRGTTALARAASETSEQDLVAAMLGDHAGERRLAPRAPRAAGEVVVVADDVTLRDMRGLERVRRASFRLHRGELVGIAGVEGSGQHELLRAIAGRLTPASGTLSLPDSIGFVPEDRQHDALFLDGSLTENVALRGAGARRGWQRWNEMTARTADLLRAFDVRAPGPDVPARTLSGGNQQKLVLARELEGPPRLLVAENPVRGLDIRATATVLDRLRAACDDGITVVLYSSDLDEVLALADRMLVLFGGGVVETAPDREAVGRAMLGAA
jgi:ABC-type uncharacterized transport system ATPase subunit